MNNSYNLQRYLSIDDYIKRLEEEKRLISKQMYYQTLATHIAYDGLRVHVVAPKIEYIVMDNIKACELVDERIERWKYRQKHFNRFLFSLGLIERESLIEGLGDKLLIERALDEIYEIETATAFKFGYEPPEEKIELEDDLFLDIALLAEVL